MLRFQFVADAWPLLASLVVCAALAALAFRSRRAPMVEQAGWFFVAACWVTFCHFLEVVTVDLAAKVFWIGLQIPGLAAAVALLTAVTLIACDRGDWLRRPQVRYQLWGGVVAITALAWSNPNHGLFWRDSRVDPETGAAAVDFGWLGYLVLWLAALVLILIAVALGRQAFSRTAANRHQAQLLLLAVLAPALASILEALGLDPLPGVRTGILLLFVSSALLAAAVFAYGQPDLEDVAHDLVVETIQTPIVLLDMHNQILELNPYAQRLLDVENDRISGRPIGQVWSEWPSDPGPKATFEVGHSKHGVETHYSAHRSPIEDRTGAVVAAVFVLTDITSRKRNEQHLAEQALRDPLTGIMNRRSFFEHAEGEYRRARRRDHSLSVFVIDVDNFSEINNRYGQFAGDEALKTVSQISEAQLRGEDLLARHGGDEFIAMLSELEQEQAANAAERLRIAIERSSVSFESHTFRFTVSIGVSYQWQVPSEESPIAGIETLIRAAEAALSESKEAGRNRVTVRQAS